MIGKFIFELDMHIRSSHGNINNFNLSTRCTFFNKKFNIVNK